MIDGMCNDRHPPTRNQFLLMKGNGVPRNDFCAELKPEIDTSDAVMCKGECGEGNGGVAKIVPRLRGRDMISSCIVARKALVSIPC